MNKAVLKYAFAAVALFIGPTAAIAQTGDADRGANLFKKCAACHMVGPDARKRAGPVLNDIMGAPAAGQSDYRYSNAFKAAATDGLIWTNATLDAFLENPKAYIPRTKMSFRGLPKPQDRADIIAYLAAFSDPQQTAAVVQGFTVSADILSIQGDVEYGEYLSSECTTCHQSSGGDDGIPSIVGWDIEPFVTAMHAYREKHRDNPVMQMVTGRLSDAEIAALAAYFNGLNN